MPLLTSYRSIQSLSCFGEPEVGSESRLFTHRNSVSKGYNFARKTLKLVLKNDKRPVNAKIQVIMSETDVKMEWKNKPNMK